MNNNETFVLKGEYSLSWTKISSWSAGRTDEAIKMIMDSSGSDENIYMREGKRIHSKIAEGKFRLLPFMKDTGRFELPNGENPEEKRKDPNYFRVEVFDWLDMSMLVDYLDPVEGLIIDWKSGSRKSTEHNKMQLYVYAYLLSRLPEPIIINRGVIAKVWESPEGVVSCSDFSLYKINEEKLEIAENYIESNASEIYNMIVGMRNGND